MVYNNLMRVLFVIGAALSASVSLASFDLMFVQQVSQDTGGTFRMHRIDPTTGAYLGSFSSGPATMGMAASLSRGELYTCDINGNLRTWDYSQGTLKSVRNLGWGGVNDITLSADGSEIISSHTNGDVRIFNVLTSSVTGVTNVGFVGAKIAHATGNVYVAYSTAGHSLRRLLRSGITFTHTSSEAVTPSITAGSVGGLAVVNGGFFPTIYSANTGGNSYGLNYFTSSTNDFAGYGPYSNGLSGHTNSTGVVRSHVGVYLAGQDSSGAGLRITEFDTAGYAIRSNVVAGITGGARSVAIVLAPEPSSLLGLAGLGLLLLRRRSLQ